MQFRQPNYYCCSERHFPPPVSHKPPPLHRQLRERWSPQPNCQPSQTRRMCLPCFRAHQL